MGHRFLSLPLGALLFLGLGAFGTAQAPVFRSDFSSIHDRIWIGPGYWANPMEWWRIQGERLEVLRARPGLNVHLLTCRLGPKRASFEISVLAELLEKGPSPGSAGFRIGAKDEVPDYRAAALRGRGLDCGITTDGMLFLGRARKKTKRPFTRGRIVLKGTPGEGETYTLELSVQDGDGTAGPALSLRDVPGTVLEGSLALLNNAPFLAPRRPRGKGRRPLYKGARFAFREWVLRGEKLEFHPERAFGPILWTMHTLSDSRGPEGFVLKMTAQMPPLGKEDSHQVRLQVKKEGKWVDVAAASIHADARTATFRVPRWKAAEDVPYRVVYRNTGKKGGAKVFHYEGTVRKNPSGRPLVVAAFTGNCDSVFPNLQINKSVAAQNPDVLFFSGDQIYEGSGDFAILRKPLDISILNYLRKWYLFGWSFGNLMRDRVTICLPDDHDVYQGNLWGEGGIDCHGIRNHPAGGYAQPVRFVNVVHRTNTSHHPDLYDPTPAARGITVYYGDMVYGRVSFAMVGDREFKSGPKGKVDTGRGRPDWVLDPNVDVRALDKPGLKLLGDRQLAFLRAWGKDWRGADLKVLLSETIFCNLANYHGPNQIFVRADLDSGGWPQSGRRRAIDALRRCFALHVAGDQHLGSLVWHGIDEFRDSCWSFCVPSIANYYPRSWRPDEEGRPVRNRPAPGLPDTGDYLDGFENKISVFAVANPVKRTGKKRVGKGRLARMEARSSGYGIIRMDTEKQTFTVECWRIDADPAHPRTGDQYPGWPRTIRMLDNYGRKAKAWLPEIHVQGRDSFVVQVLEERSGEMVYTLRIRGNRFRPKVFSTAPCTLRVGEPDRGVWRIFPHMEPTAKKEGLLQVRL